MYKVLIPLFLGIIAGLLSYIITFGVRGRDPLGIIVLVLFIYIQKFILRRFEKIEAKDWISISFMTFAGWYIFWVFLLNL
ncbi:MAG: hypothetical protein NZ895_00530 [Archaeoglobaceae archaeon]|nr:hypothetical protein [Archaeoglobaceae archaeon]MCX8151904.1 hypothetical protein [Archaeoglobaceae archaeon]MDW8013293.1 hypothetical protein [Archaeoglobaceae archaeon]